jgi:plastocyanin
MQRRVLLPVLLAGALTIAACGGDDAAPATAPPTADVVVVAKNIQFTESSYSATAGDVEIAYLNEDNMRHTLLILDENGDQVTDTKLEVNSDGDVDVATVNLPAGSYILFCDVPGHTQMQAPLTVS